MTSRKKLFVKFIALAILITILVLVSNAIIQNVLPSDGGEDTTSRSFPIGAIIGIFGSIVFLMTFLIGIPSFQKWYRSRKGLSRKQMLNLHCDLATTATISIAIHVIIVSTMPKYADIINWYSIYPWFYPGFSESWKNIPLSITLGSWALFFMIVATIAGYLRRWIYKRYSRTSFIVIQNFTIISLIALTLHELTIGQITERNIIIRVLIIGITVFLVFLWLLYNLQVFQAKSKSGTSH